MKPIFSILICLMIVCTIIGCHQQTSDNAAMQQSISPKITFDVNNINKDGLYGPPDGLRALDYEFCIPATDAAEAEVKQIDPTVKFHKNSPGRAGCSEEEYLCIGTTHQKDFRSVLAKLAALDYIRQIDQSFYE